MFTWQAGCRRRAGAFSTQTTFRPEMSTHHKLFSSKDRKKRERKRKMYQDTRHVGGTTAASHRNRSVTFMEKDGYAAFAAATWRVRGPRERGHFRCSDNHNHHHFHSHYSSSLKSLTHSLGLRPAPPSTPTDCITTPRAALGSAR